MASADFEEMEVDRLVVKEFSEQLLKEANEPNVLTLTSIDDQDVISTTTSAKKKKKPR